MQRISIWDIHKLHLCKTAIELWKNDELSGKIKPFEKQMACSLHAIVASCFVILPAG